MSNAQRAARRTPVRVQSPSSNRRLWIIGAMVAVAVAAVATLIIVQSSGGSTKVPERTSSGQGRVLGDANAPVTLVEYADFQCPVCKRAETDLLPRIQKDYIDTGKVKLEFRMYPFIGQESWNAAQAADAAGEQGKFWEYHDALFNAQGARENGGAFTYDNLVSIAKNVGLDVAKFEESFGSNKYLDPIQKEADAAHGAGVSSTPTFFVGDKKISGLQPYVQFQSAIDAALAKAAP
jgi:protein-disulfide isomerase